jgi:hypothetical protein
MTTSTQTVTPTTATRLRSAMAAPAPATEKVTTMADYQELQVDTAPAQAPAASLDAFDRCLAHLKGMSDKQVADTAKQLFPENHYQRIVFDCWVRGVQYGEVRGINPKSYAPNFVGEPGLGKTGMIMEAGEIIEEWLTSVAGEFVPFRIEVLSLASCNDIAEVLGVVHLDHVNKRTCIYPHENLPVRGDRTFGLLFMDDVNRGTKDAQGGIMQLASALSYNGYRMPRTWGVIAATNPSGKNHAVKAQDQAQDSRWIKVLYAPSRDKAFIQQLQKQGVPATFTGYCMKYKHIAKVPDSAGILPDVAYTNFRNVTMVGHLYGILKHDERAWQEVAYSNLGANEMRNLEAMLQGETPLDSHEIVGLNATERKNGEEGLMPAKAWELAKPRLLAFDKEGRTDLIMVSTHGLVRHLNHPQFSLSDDQLDVFADLVMNVLPKEAGTDLLRRLVLKDAPRADVYKPKLTMWNSPDGKTPGPLAVKFLGLLNQMKQDLEAGLGRKAS